MARDRDWLDSALIVFTLGLAFWSGVQYSTIQDLKEAVTTPGRVQISIEARTRLTALEEHDKEQDARINRIESKVLNGHRQP